LSSPTKEALLAGGDFAPYFYQTNPFSKVLSRDRGDLLVHGQGWWDVGLSIAGGIETLEFVQALRTLLCGLVAGDLREGSGGVGMQIELRPSAAISAYRLRAWATERVASTYWRSTRWSVHLRKNGKPWERHIKFPEAKGHKPKGISQRA